MGLSTLLEPLGTKELGILRTYFKALLSRLQEDVSTKIISFDSFSVRGDSQQRRRGEVTAIFSSAPIVDEHTSLARSFQAANTIFDEDITILAPSSNFTEAECNMEAIGFNPENSMLSPPPGFQNIVPPPPGFNTTHDSCHKLASSNGDSDLRKISQYETACTQDRIGIVDTSSSIRTHSNCVAVSSACGNQGKDESKDGFSGLQDAGSATSSSAGKIYASSHRNS